MWMQAVYFFSSLSARFLHIAVAKGRRALAFALAARMSTSGCLDLKEHNGQVRLGDTLSIC